MNGKRREEVLNEKFKFKRWSSCCWVKNILISFNWASHRAEDLIPQLLSIHEIFTLFHWLSYTPGLKVGIKLKKIIFSKRLMSSSIRNKYHFLNHNWFWYSLFLRNNVYFWRGVQVTTSIHHYPSPQYRLLFKFENWLNSFILCRFQILKSKPLLTFLQLLWRWRFSYHIEIVKHFDQFWWMSEWKFVSHFNLIVFDKKII